MIDKKLVDIADKIADKSSMLMVKAKCIDLHDNKQKVLKEIASLIDDIYDTYALLLKHLRRVMKSDERKREEEYENI